MDLHKYIGHKRIDGVYQKIINHIPAHTRYGELFAGSAAIYSLLKLSEEIDVILNDKNPEVAGALLALYPETKTLSECAIAILSRFAKRWQTETFIFLDPPYHHDTRARNDYYDYELTEAAHVRLLIQARKMVCKVMIIHPKCDLYDNMLHDWQQVPIKIQYWNKTSHEVLYMNYATIEDLQTYDHLGANCWDRQAIKRKGDNLVRKLNRLPELERKYMLQRIKEVKS